MYISETSTQHEATFGATEDVETEKSDGHKDNAEKKKKKKRKKSKKGKKDKGPRQGTIFPICYTTFA